MPGPTEYNFARENVGFEEDFLQDMDWEIQLGYNPDLNYQPPTDGLDLDIQYERNLQNVGSYLDPGPFGDSNFVLHEFRPYPDDRIPAENSFPVPDFLQPIEINQTGTWITGNNNNYMHNQVSNSSARNNQGDSGSLDALCTAFEPDSHYRIIPSHGNSSHNPGDASTPSTFPKVLTPTSSDQGSSSCCQPTPGTDMSCGLDNDLNSFAFDPVYGATNNTGGSLDYRPNADDNPGNATTGGARKKRGKLTSDQKKKINAVRKRSACIRCQMMRESVGHPICERYSWLLT